MTVYALSPTPHIVPLLPKGDCVCALGLFDGVHLGHAMLLQKTATLAEQAGITPIVWCLRSASYKGAKDLCTLEEKLARFAACGVAYAIVEDFSAICNLSAQSFVKNVLIDSLSTVSAVCGEDFRFGKGGVGTADLLQSELSVHGAHTVCLPKLKTPTGQVISAKSIRAHLEAGEIEEANAQLGYPYTLSATVSEGKRLGRRIGFPTANLYPPSEKVLPPFGVYICEGTLQDGRTFQGVCNIGRNPTTDQLPTPRLEVHLFCDAIPDLYGQSVTVSLRKLLRREQSFPSIEALKAAIDQNVAQAKAYFTI